MTNGPDGKKLVKMMSKKVKTVVLKGLFLWTHLQNKTKSWNAIYKNDSRSSSGILDSQIRWFLRKLNQVGVVLPWIE
ncbi:hypothetical protein SNEBB_006248 [Seison nebaliae]|nr:hypothetical protein SNEBB_006248 [Seison nebaliae]